MIRIWTNFQYCDEIQIFKQAIKISPQNFKTRLSKWKELVTGNFEEKDDISLSKMEEYSNNWLSFRYFSQNLVRQISGDKIIYLDDQKYQIQEDKFNEGQSLKKVIELLSLMKEPCALELLEAFPNEKKVKHA